MTDGTAARRAAFEILRRVRAGQLFDAARQRAVAELNLPDRRLAQQIAAGVLRRRTALDRRLKPLLADGWRRTSPDLKDLLRIGTFQLVDLDRVPSYGAVDATVELAKRVRGARGAGLVNAVLRKVAAGEAPEPALDPEAPVAGRLAQMHSHPQWLVHRWLDRFGVDRVSALLDHNNRRPPVVLRPVRWTEQALRQALERRGVAYRAAPLGAGLAVEGAVSELPGFVEGGFVVQDPAQSWLLEQVAIPDGSTVWDACAAPGGKAAVLSRRCRVVASDVERHRLARARQTLARAAPDVSLLLADARHPPVDPRCVDVVLLDAPCTATGTFARHPDARWRVSSRRLANAVRRQAELLNGASLAVRPGGLLIYLTCSLEREENEVQIDSFLERHPVFVRDQEDVALFPPDFGTDGGFGARLRRNQ